MNFIEESLIKGEKILHSANTHWFVYIPGILAVCFSLLEAFITHELYGSVAAYKFSIFLLLGILLIARAWLIGKTTELKITNKRIIAKFGILNRDSVELNLSKVESFSVKQSIVGRLFDFGTIVINGTGGGKVPIPNIQSPLIFRKNAAASIEIYVNTQQHPEFTVAPDRDVSKFSINQKKSSRFQADANTVFFVALGAIVIAIVINLNIDNVDARAKSLIKKEHYYDEVCRGGTGDSRETWIACEQRDQLAKELRSLGWCFGRTGDFGYQMRWRKCDPNERPN